MNRAELRALVAELREVNHDATFELRPRLTMPRGVPGARYQVDVSVTVTRSLYFDPHDDVPADEARELAQEEVYTLLHSCSEVTLARLRHQRLAAWAPQNPVARQLLERPLAVPFPGFRPPGPNETALLNLPGGPTPDRAGPALSPGLLPPSLQRVESLMQVVNSLGGLGYSPEALSVPREPEPEKPVEPEATSLWEMLEDEG